MWSVFTKELADHFGHRRFFILLGLIVLSAVWAAFIAVRTLGVTSGETPEELTFLQLFTTGSGVLPSFLFFLSFFGPLIGITLGFDAINTERSQGTLARVLAQPIYRDAFFNGKFLAGVATIVVIQISIVLIVVGLGMFILGFAPTFEALARIFLFTISTIVYMSFWLALSMLCSVWCQKAMASALTALALWLFFGFIMLMIASAVADVIVTDTDTEEQAIRRVQVENMVRRASPVTLFQEATAALMSPTTKTLGPVLMDRVGGLQLLSPLSISQSLLLVWPHLVTILAAMGICFGVSYARFLREEIRS